jgi:hypothetical protein
MRYFPALIAVAVVVGLAACGAGIKLPPVSPDQVEVFMPGSFPSEDYKVMLRIMESVPLSTSDSELVDRAKAKAAEVGADALLIDAIRRTTEGGIQTDLRQEELKIIEARAVYFPSKHPELSNK